MAKNKKRKKATGSKQPSLHARLHNNKEYKEQFYATARKHMQLVGLEPDAFDNLPKRVREAVMFMNFYPPIISAAEDFKVPRLYIRLFNMLMMDKLRAMYYADPAFGIKYIDHLIYGQALICGLRRIASDIEGFPAEQVERVKIIAQKMTDWGENKENECYHYFPVLSKNLCFMMMFFTKINYHYYTCEFNWVSQIEKARIQIRFTFSSIESERRQFVVRKQARPAFRLGCYLDQPKPEWASIPMQLLTPQYKNNIDIPVFIQQHTLIRLRERLSPQDNLYINGTLSLTFFATRGVQIKQSVKGNPLICVYDANYHIGYFSFVQQDGCVLLTSFLPLSSPDTPEGNILQQLLGFSIEDSAYLNMDKLSFYKQTDFEALPTLTKALKEAGIWHLTKIRVLYEESTDKVAKINHNSTEMLVKIFEKDSEN